MPEKIKYADGRLVVPDNPIIPVIQGDGVGPEIWRAVGPILKKAAQLAGKSLEWLMVPAGQESFEKTGQYLPPDTLEALKSHIVSIKGPLSTPVGGGIRSLNVQIRQELDLYACVRPISWIPGVPSPVKRPEAIDMVIFRENTEDVYAGIEWKAGSGEAQALSGFIKDKLGVGLRPGSAIGIKPMTEFCTKRLVKKAIEWAFAERRPSLTLVHKGNIMKFTEGAFRAWGYEAAGEYFPGRTVKEENANGPGEARLVMKDRIADNMFMQTLTRPGEYSVIATPNLNGDYLSDALAAQIGGLGMAPGANIGDFLAVFEAVHGTAPKYAGKDLANPTSLLLSGAMMLDYLGWRDAGSHVRRAVREAIAAKAMTQDLARQMDGQKAATLSEYAAAILGRMQ